MRRPADVVAQRLIRELVEFPGGHLGYTSFPAAFVERLVEVLALPACG
ncbi:MULTISPECIES: hypothetical protein [unclassified Streptomyces]|nr:MULTISPECIES: hypothetical protein [unclassified Streptomyces]MYT32299.1 hypothetical protein [Streptomyces sp. SID8354]